MIQCCTMIGWTYLVSSSFILFALNLEWLVTKILEGIFLQLYFYTHKDKKVKAHACFRTRTCPWETFELVLNWWSGFPSNTNLRVLISRFTTRSAVFMINTCIYNHPFKVFMNRKHEGVKDLVCGNVRETNWFGRFLIWALIQWDVNEVTSMFINVIFLF
jgi:hypothetical protein